MGYVGQPQIAIDADGDALVNWSVNWDWGSSYARSISAAGAIGPLLSISPAGGWMEGMRVAVNPSGKALFVWCHLLDGQMRIQARFGSTAGTLGPVQTLPFGDSLPRAVLAPEGDGLLVWSTGSQATSRIEAVTISAAGVFGTAKTISTVGGSSSKYLGEVALNAQRQVVVVWRNPTGTRDQAEIGAAAGTLP